MSKEYNIGIYIRLSIADEDTGYGSKAESDSIGNQRMLINRFLDNHPELSHCQRSEFADDGYTGTNFHRPQFAQMMEKVKRGEINLICVKDFSRFSRDYIETGNYLECTFPFMGVRFISINDGYDSDNYKGTTGGLEVVMRSIIYAAYSKDLSVKTTSAKIQMMKQGKYVGGYAPYGYVLHPTIRNKLAVDPEAADVIRRIFREALEGSNTSQIARSLNDDGIPTPGQYFKSKHPDKKKFSNMSEKISWETVMVYNILKNLVYTGTLVSRKMKSCGVGSKKRVVNEPIIVEGMVWMHMETVISYILHYEDHFRAVVQEQLKIESDEKIQAWRKQLTQAEKRIAELGRLFVKIYEDNAKGKLSDERFSMMSGN